MRQILDLHIHSKYSRACSPNLTLANIDTACRTKGVDIIATGDFTYPAWFDEIKNELEEVDNTGLHVLKSSEKDKIDPVKSREAGATSSQFDRVKFILSTELALIYKSGDKVRRIHLVVHAPNIEAVRELNGFLDKKYNIRSDGRPILGMSAMELFKLCLSIHPKFLIYPAHIWTPWFSVFGSKSGFDKLEECFGEFTDRVFALETGLSSDPEMNWRVSALDRLTILSNSDAHSLQNIGREANIFDLEQITYDEIYEVIKKKDLNRIKGTIEFYPEEGMYHFDGHRDCKVVMSPQESRKAKGICPVCKKSLTIGVASRVEELADRPEGAKPVNVSSFHKSVSLDKIIAEALGIKSRSSKQVIVEYDKMINKFGNELDILLEIDLEEINKFSLPEIAEGIKRVRGGALSIKPGFDGQYGQISIFIPNEPTAVKQSKLF